MEDGTMPVLHLMNDLLQLARRFPMEVQLFKSTPCFYFLWVTLFLCVYLGIYNIHYIYNIGTKNTKYYSNIKHSPCTFCYQY